MIDLQNINQRKARKRYVCDLCGKAILPGNQYIHETFRGDDGFQTLRRHIHCDAMLSVYNTEYNDDEYYNSDEVTNGLWDEVCERICEEEQWGECHACDVYACELAQRELLPQHLLGAAIQSVKDNYDWSAEE